MLLAIRGICTASTGVKPMAVAPKQGDNYPPGTRGFSVQQGCCYCYCYLPAATARADRRAILRINREASQPHSNDSRVARRLRCG